MKRNGHLNFQCVIDCWGVRSDAGMPGAILSCNVVATRGFSSHNCVTKSKLTSRRRKKLRILRAIRDQR